ncbi:MAG TPA: NAD(+)/NADH kinase [Chthonomonadales bacterium]|nr:NAD(+)/NADH kinase [Chthonomonadales bacterium]
MAPRSIGLIVHPTRPEAHVFAREVIGWLCSRGVSVCADAAYAGRLGQGVRSVCSEELTGVDLMVTLGGDGTILAASHLASPHGIPILGVHMGRFGFIAEALPEDLFAQLDEILAGRITVQERMMLRGTVYRDGRPIHSAVGLNDVVLNKGARARLSNIQVAFGSEEVATYPADGVVVATPTGSTGYALSAGGPLIEPTVYALAVVPICPHTLAARSLVAPADEVIHITVESDGGEMLFSADSDALQALAAGDRVEVRCAEFAARMVVQNRSSFYRKVRERLLWGGRENGLPRADDRASPL